MQWAFEYFIFQPFRWAIATQEHSIALSGRLNDESPWVFMTAVGIVVKRVFLSDRYRRLLVEKAEWEI